MILALDLGSKRIGAVAAPRALPLCIDPARHATIEVNPDDIDSAVSVIAGMMRLDAFEAVVVEHGTLYMPRDKDAAALQKIADAHEVCARIHENVRMLCRDRGIPMVTLARQSWAHRVVPHTRGGITDEMVNAGLAAHVDPTSLSLLADQDQRDAAGVLVGWILGPPQKGRRKGAKGPPRVPRTAEQRVADRRATVARYLAKRGSKRAAKRAAAGCNCGPAGGPRPAGARGRHARFCPAGACVRKAAEATAPYVPTTRPAT